MTHVNRSKDINAPLVRDPETEAKTVSRSTLHDGEGVQTVEAVQAQESKRRKRRIMKIAVYILFGIIAIGVFAIWLFHKDDSDEIRLDSRFLFIAKMRTLKIENEEQETMLFGDFGIHLKATPFDLCWDSVTEDYIENCLHWKRMAELQLSRDVNSSTPCYTVEWTGISQDFMAEDCFYLLKTRWYGHVAHSDSLWPVTNTEVTGVSFYPRYPASQRNNRVPFWLSSSGISIIVDSNVPFQVSWNHTLERQFCLRSELTTEDTEGSLLKYSICRGKNLKDVYYNSRTHIHRSVPETAVPTDGFILSQPILAAINKEQTDTLQHLLEKLEMGCGLVEIRETWEQHWGDLDIPDPASVGLEDVLAAVQRWQCKILLPLSTFVNYRSTHFIPGMDNGYFMKGDLNLATRLITWQDQEGALLDLSSRHTSSWYLQQLERLVREDLIRGFKLLHVGIPHGMKFSDNATQVLDYPRLFAEVVTALNMTVLMDYIAGFMSESVYAIVHAETAIINGHRCFNSTLPLTLLLGVGGYPLIVSDGELLKDEVLTLDLLARWLQLSVFYPAMRIPALPFLREKNATDLIKNMIKLRVELLVPEMQRMSAMGLDEPLIRPLWWIDPNDEVAQSVDDQFLFGDSMLVAPILCEGVMSRNVYLPTGRWRSADKTQNEIDGGRWVRVQVDYLHQIPYFRLV